MNVEFQFFNSIALVNYTNGEAPRKIQANLFY